MKNIKLSLLILIILNQFVFPAGKGTLKGKILDGETKLPIIGANVVLMNTKQGASTDTTGNFTIVDVNVGTYSLRISCIGYETKTLTDVIVTPDRITFIESDLKPAAAYEMNAVKVNSGYFSTGNLQPVSATNFSYEEIRRAPGAAGDVSRILMNLPSIAKVNDQSNSLIVRGGNPAENAFFIDNIEVPNINHFPTQGSTGGPIGMVNVDLVKDLNFYAGGFSSIYVDRLSSVMEINFKDGNKDEFEGEANLDFAGFGGVVEGPLSNKGSYIVSIRRSYLDYLIKAIDVGTSIAPRYADYQWNVVYNINPSNKLSFIGLIGSDLSESNEKTAEENQMEAFGKQTMNETTIGANLRTLWGTVGYSNTSLSFTNDSFNETYFKAAFGNLLLDNNSTERSFKLRNVNHINLSGTSSLEFGTDVKYLFNNYNSFYGETIDLLGNTTPSLNMKWNIDSYKAGLFINYEFNPVERLTVNTGIRSDYFSFNNKLSIDPRFSFKYKLSESTSLNGSAGFLHQTIPMVLLAQSNENKKLNDMAAVQYILGVDHLITESTKLSLEIYDKEYYDIPVDPSQPSFFIIDEDIYNNSFYQYHPVLIGSGRAYSRGIELTVQKKLATDYYGFASASYSKCRYKALDGIWRDRAFDNQYSFSLEGGYKPNNQWEFSARWIIAGGVPYTPFNYAASHSANTGIVNDQLVNEARYPSYQCLNVRFDKRFNFQSSDIVFYLSIWNAYSRKNVADYFWNSFKNKQDTIYQWTSLPIFGIKYEF